MNKDRNNSVYKLVKNVKQKIKIKKRTKNNNLT